MLAKREKKLWGEFALYIKNRDGNRCYTCGRLAFGRALNAGHFISKQIAVLRYDPHNVHSQCSACNANGGNVGAYAKRIIKEYGQRELDRMAKLSSKKIIIDQPIIDKLLLLLQKSANFETGYYKLIKGINKDE